MQFYKKTINYPEAEPSRYHKELYISEPSIGALNHNIRVHRSKTQRRNKTICTKL